LDAAERAASVQVLERAACVDGEKLVLCPDAPAVAEGKRGTCQASRKDCGAAGAQSACEAAGKRWCGISCIDMRLRCPKTRACRVGSVRCADGSCATRADKCPSDASLCGAAGEVPCGDGVTCAADAKACRATVQLDGCPVGQLACASNPKECRADKKDCRCAAAGTSFCGWQRSIAGRLERRAEISAAGETALRKVPVCSATCGGSLANPLTVALEPAPMYVSPLADTVQPLMAASDESSGARGADANRTVGLIRIPKGAVVAAGAEDEPVTFAIKPVSLADATEGSFKGLDMMSAALTLIADRVVKIDGDSGIQIDLCVDAGQDLARCTAVLQRLRPFSAQNLAAGGAEEVVGGCRRGAACGCSCLFSTPHLTTFVVADPNIPVEGETTTELLEARIAEEGEPGGGGAQGGAPTPAPPAPGGGGAQGGAPTPAPPTPGGGGAQGGAPTPAPGEAVPKTVAAAAAAVVAVLALVAIVAVMRRRRLQAALHHGSAAPGAAPVNPITELALGNRPASSRFSQDNPMVARGAAHSSEQLGQRVDGAEGLHNKLSTRVLESSFV